MLDRHSRSHDHDLIKVFALFLQVVSGLILQLFILSDQLKRNVAEANTIIFATVGVIIIIANAADLLHDFCSNKRPLHENKEVWLVTTSKILVFLGVLAYYTGKNLPKILSEFSLELGCDPTCEERVLIAGVFFLFVSLSTFTFIPSIFRKINKVVNPEYSDDYIRENGHRGYTVQYLVLRMTALVLNFDTIYTGVWVYAFVDVKDCNTDDIIGSSASIIAGWITWSLYALAYVYYLTNFGSILKHVKYCKILEIKYRILNGFYYGFLILFFVTFFPIHILASNTEPLSCGCSNLNKTLIVFTCGERVEVLKIRIALFFHQVTILTALGVIGAVKYSLKEIDNTVTIEN